MEVAACLFLWLILSKPLKLQDTGRAKGKASPSLLAARARLLLWTEAP